ncbi:Piso0_001583 [Millerozyma farinosa CBS 7064]|uniref:Piso0_001583 protein n=1 Tax=Pichia sorbitophila (strain ATCC MYA-4447 / BCRC 22081 / CBS 7064 / NBRC 10061 / NRRL Y-12695) TaxID=559304 RepID=G8YNJ7_PICSO|nr:Piso0_001583 [Millerozyma farinosa CBS 7064]
MLSPEIPWLISSYILECKLYFDQLQFNKRKKSIYGLSYDFIVLSWCSAFLSVTTTLNYGLSQTVLDQYHQRYPSLPTVRISYVIIILETCKLFITSGLMIQILFLYKRTKHNTQGISGILLAFGAFFLMSTLWVAKCCIKKEAALFYLDLVDLIWFTGKVADAFYLVPQASLNSIGRNVVGTCQRFLFLSWLSFFMTIIGMSTLVCKNHAYYEIPINYTSWTSLFIKVISLILFSLQQKLIYKDANISSKEIYSINATSQV